MDAPAKEFKKHFILVHGVCHGAWCWYRVRAELEKSGHRVTLIDLAASGTNKKEIHEVQSFYEYSEPLLKVMSSLAPNEKVILVGHSLGGLNIALAMEMLPEKVSVAVFLTAVMPDCIHHPSYVVDQYLEMTPVEFWKDTQTSTYATSSGSFTSMYFGPNMLASTFYQLSPIEDYELAVKLSRPGSLFREDLSKAKKFSEKAYGSVNRIFVVCDNDKAITKNFQRWMIENGGVKEVMEIIGADHMPMFSQTERLCNCLLKIAKNY